MGKLKNAMLTIDNSPTNERIANHIEEGKTFHEVLERISETPEMKHEVYYHKTEIQKKLRAGRPLEEILDEHFTNEGTKAEVRKHLANDREIYRKGGKV